MMLVLQQIDVLPAGSDIVIMDGDKVDFRFLKCESDESLIFNDAHDADKYYKMLCNFHVYGLKANLGEGHVIYQLQIRDGYGKI